MKRKISIIAIMLLVIISVYAYWKSSMSHSTATLKLETEQRTTPSTLQNIQNTTTQVETTNENIDKTDLYPDSFVVPKYSISEAIQYQNLAICMIYSTTELEYKKYITLEKALDSKQAIVHETSNVNNLSIDNLSSQYLFVHSGDIVKGGQQDRTLGFDMILSPNSKQNPIKSFCVEHGRWSQREGEAVDNFNQSTYMVSTKELKVASKVVKDQSAVWDEVSNHQTKLNDNLGEKYKYTGSVNAAVSESSLQLTLENKALDSIRNEYQNHFKKIDKLDPACVGFAYFINGTCYGIDIYNNHALFSSLWKKMLLSCITESISTTDSIQKNVLYNRTIDNIIHDSYMTYETQTPNKNTYIISSKDKRNSYTVLTTFDLIENKKWIHRSWIAM